MVTSTTPLFLPLLLLSLTLSGGQGARPPHIVVIIADDLGWNDVGYRDPEMVTPNINRLAEEGVLLNSSYMLKSCTPSRSTLLAGTYAFKMGLQDSSLVVSENDSVPLNKRFFPQDLQDLGYSTHLVGKWHLGFCQLEMTPTYRGFDTFYGMYNGEGDYFTHLSKKKGFDIQNNKGHGHGRKFAPDLSAKGIYSTDLFTSKAVEIIAEHDQSKPLFLMLSYQAVHGPLEVPERYVRDHCAHVSSGGRERKVHCAMTAAMDEGIGKVRDALDSYGFSDNLVTFFTTDNGGPVKIGSSNWPLRGAKITEWEGGTRAVSILHSKSHLPDAPYTWNGLIHAVDWYPTLLGLATGSTVNVEGIDGVDNWDRIANNQPSRRTEFVYNINEVKENYGLRWNQYKLLSLKRPNPDGWYNPPAGQCSRPEPKGTYPEYMLFDIDEDPTEERDISGEKEYKDIVKTMKKKLRDYKEQMVPTRPKFRPDSGVPVDYHGDLVWTSGWCGKEET